MKHNLKRMLSAILALSLLAAMPFAAFAETEVEWGGSSETSVPAAGSIYTDTGSAAAYVRERLKARDNDFTVVVETGKLVGLSSNSLSSAISEMMHTIWNTAMAHTGTSTEGDFLRYQIGGFQGGYTYTYDDSLVHIEFRYQSVHYYMDFDQENQTAGKVQQIVDSLDLKGRPDFVKASAIYSYICRNISYDKENLHNNNDYIKFTASGALSRNKAVCQGFAVLFYQMALAAGLDARVIAGTCNGEPHAWNLVRIDGTYYNLDATWDAGQAPENFEYFLKTDAAFSADHVRSSEFQTAAFQKAYPMTAVNYL